MLYVRLLDRTKHLKVWISYAEFEATAINKESLDLSEQEQKKHVFSVPEVCNHSFMLISFMIVCFKFEIQPNNFLILFIFCFFACLRGV